MPGKADRPPKRAAGQAQAAMDPTETGKASVGPLPSAGIRLNIGCADRPKAGWTNLDIAPLPGVDVVWDLEKRPYPFADGTVVEIEASHVLEHIRDLLACMQELHRILAPGGVLHVKVPYYRWHNAYDDPTHVRFFTERTMDYFDAAHEFAFYSQARFRVKRLARNRLTTFPWWHLRKYTRVPVGRVWELEWWLEKA